MYEATVFSIPNYLIQSFHNKSGRDAVPQYLNNCSIKT